MKRLFNKKHKSDFASIDEKIDYGTATTAPNKGKVILISSLSAALAFGAAFAVGFACVPRGGTVICEGVLPLNSPQKPFNSSVGTPGDTYVSSMTSFSARLGSLTYGLDGNADGFVLSPLSLATTFSMVYEGANAQTKEELREALGYPEGYEPKYDIQTMLLRNAIDADTPQGKAYLNVDQAIFADYSFSPLVSPRYLSTLTDHYFAEVYQAELGDMSAKEALAGWINGKTREFFHLKPEDFKELEGLMWLCNALYVKAPWEQWEEQKETPFHNLNGTLTQNHFLSGVAPTMVYRYPDFDVFSLSFEAGISISFLLPSGEDCSCLSKSETYAALVSPQKEYGKGYRLSYRFPQFKKVQNHDAKTLFQELGVTALFTEAADLTPVTDGKADLYVAQAIHASGIDLNKDGVEAAAYTVVSYGEASSGNEFDPLSLTVDRPFAYCLKSPIGSPLILGAINNL